MTVIVGHFQTRFTRSKRLSNIIKAGLNVNPSLEMPFTVQNIILSLYSEIPNLEPANFDLFWLLEDPDNGTDYAPSIHRCKS